MAAREWKRAQRRANRGSPYWLDFWLKKTGDLSAARLAYNHYMRRYMRRYRRRRRKHGSDPPKPLDDSSGQFSMAA